MTVVFRLSDLLHELFPHDEGDTEALLSAMRGHYRLGDVEPTVTIEGEMVIVEVDGQHAGEEADRGRCRLAIPRDYGQRQGIFQGNGKDLRGDPSGAHSLAHECAKFTPQGARMLLKE